MRIRRFVTEGIGLIGRIFNRIFPTAMDDAERHKGEYMKELTQHERYILATDLCRKMGTTPAYIFDSIQMVSNREYHIDVVKVERFLNRVGHSVGDGESIADVVKRVYGDLVVDLIQKLM